MRAADILGFATLTLRIARGRTLLMLLAMAIGVAAVVILTALGDGARRFVTGEFSSLGTNLIIVLPGKSETAGGMGPPAFATTRDLTIADMQALMRNAGVRRVAPINIGAVPVSWRGRTREVPVMGSTADLLPIRHWEMAQGRFLPPGDPERAAAVCVLGAKVRAELFGSEPVLGEWLRLGDRRCRITGVLASEGRSIGTDVEELVIVPVALGEMLFNTRTLFRILIEAHTRDSIPRVKDFVTATLKERHQGEEDVTVVTQDAVLATFDRIFQALTYTVAGIAGISLSVAGILIMNVMLVAVSQRRAEVGLLKAIGARQRQIMILFLTEAALLSLMGAGMGLALGLAGAWLIGEVYPSIAGGAPLWAEAAAVGVALITGLLFGVLPARRAARLDPVEALARR